MKDVPDDGRPGARTSHGAGITDGLDPVILADRRSCGTMTTDPVVAVELKAGEGRNYGQGNLISGDSDHRMTKRSITMKTTIACIAISLLILSAAYALAAGSPKISGEKEFKEHCAACHPDGGNIVNPKKTLHKADREANNVKSVADIVGKMRNPGPGMTQFGKETVSDKEAAAIAKYILKTFK